MLGLILQIRKKWQGMWKLGATFTALITTCSRGWEGETRKMQVLHQDIWVDLAALSRKHWLESLQRFVSTSVIIWFYHSKHIHNVIVVIPQPSERTYIFSICTCILTTNVITVLQQCNKHFVDLSLAVTNFSKDEVYFFLRAGIVTVIICCQISGWGCKWFLLTSVR